MRRLRIFPLLLWSALGGGCGTASSTTVADVIIGTAVAAGASMASRAAGGCYAVCGDGTSCNPENGFCEGPPCDGSCPRGESCRRATIGWRCLADDIEVGADGVTRRCVPQPGGVLCHPLP